MKFTCRKSILGESLGVVSKIPYPKTNLETLKGTSLEVKDGVLTIFRTNLDTSVVTSLPVKESEEGKVIVDALKVTQYVQSLPEGDDIVCELSESVFKVGSSSGSVSFNTLSSEDFPAPQDVVLEKETTVDVSILNKGLQSTVFACAKSAIRPEFASVYVYQKKDSKELCFVATDSFRLSEFSDGLEFNEFQDFLIPAPVVLSLLKVTTLLEGDISLGYGDGQLVVKQDSHIITSRLTDAVFPDYSRIIPNEFQYKIQLMKKDLLSMFRKVQIFSDTYNQVVLSVSEGGIKLTSHNQQGEGGEHTLEASLEKLDSEATDVDLKFNYMYFLEALQHVPGDMLTLYVAGVQKPLLLKDETEKAYLALIMPMSK